MGRRDFGLHKRGSYWWADFRAGGEHIHRSTRATLYEDARAIAEKWHSEANRKAQGLPVNTEILVKDLWEAWWKGTEKTLSESHRDRVERDWRLHVLPVLGERMAKSITTEDAENLRAAFLAGDNLKGAHYAASRLRRIQEAARGAGEAIPEVLPPALPRSLASSNKLLLHLSLVFAWAVKVPRTLAAVPFAVHVLKVQGKPKPTLTKEAVPAFLEAVDRASRGVGPRGGRPPANPLHVQVAVRAMLYLPLREKESLRLRWEWFSRDLQTFQHGERKTKDTPAFPVPADLRARLLGLIPHGQEVPRSGLVIPAEDGAPHRAQFTRKAIASASASLGLRLTPHSMRHSWATMTARETGNAHLVKDGLGHASMDMAMEYVKLGTADLQAAQASVFGVLATGETKSPHCHRLIKKFIAKTRKQ